LIQVRFGKTHSNYRIGKISEIDPSAFLHDAEQEMAKFLKPPSELWPTLSKNRIGLITEIKESSWSQLIEES